MLPEITTSHDLLPLKLQELIERNEPVTRKAGSVSRYLVVVTQPGHKRFGQIAQLERDWPDYEARFLNDRKFSFPHDALAFLDKTRLNKEDKEQIAAMWTGERVTLPCGIVTEKIRRYLKGKYVDGDVVYALSLQIRAHELYCAGKKCAGLFGLLSLDDTLKAGHYIKGMEPYIFKQIKSRISKI